MTNCNPGWAAAINTHRVGGHVYAKPTFGLLKFDWEAPVPTLTLQAKGLAGETAFEVKLSRDSLKPGNSN